MFVCSAQRQSENVTSSSAAVHSHWLEGWRLKLSTSTPESHHYSPKVTGSCLKSSRYKYPDWGVLFMSVTKEVPDICIISLGGPQLYPVTLCNFFTHHILHCTALWQPCLLISLTASLTGAGWNPRATLSCGSFRYLSTHKWNVTEHFRLIDLTTNHFISQDHSIPTLLENNCIIFFLV